MKIDIVFFENLSR